MNGLSRPKRVPDFTVPYKSDPCWEFFIEEGLQHNTYEKLTYEIRTLSDNTLEWLKINKECWCKFNDSRVDDAYVRYLEEVVVNNILLENE